MIIKNERRVVIATTRDDTICNRIQFSIHLCVGGVGCKVFKDILLVRTEIVIPRSRYGGNPGNCKHYLKGH